MTVGIAEQGLDPNQAFALFFKDPDWRVKSGVGGMLSAAAILMFFLGNLFIPAAFALWALLAGYNLRLMRSKIKDMNAPLPAWDDWPDLFISGLTWIAAAFGYLLVVLSVTCVALIFGAAFGVGLVQSTHVLWATATVVLVSSTMLFVSFFSTILMINFASQERTSAAFDLFTAGRKVAQSPIPFLQAWLLVLGLQMAGVVIPICTMVGLLFLPIATFLMNSVGAILLAQAWRLGEKS